MAKTIVVRTGTPAKQPRGAKSEAVVGAKARAIAKSEPVAVKNKAGKTRNPLAPERVAAILDALRKTYPGVVCALNHRGAWELTVATILSAQCTDVRVNLVTPALFKAFPTPKAMAAASLPELEELIRTTGFFRNKAKSIQGAARVVVEKFGGKVPQTMEEILTLPGVARKTGNVVLGSWFNIAVGVVVDTHVMRLSRRLELAGTTPGSTAPEKVERDLMKIIPQDRWIAFSHELIHHGRQICVARKPKCVDCTLERLCNSGDKT
ncbi:endonuclease III [Tunturiibacter gelidoferens]|uniref:Endonuclease III n=1 Tax=Tunturiibacter lichenicola TaxID=2051959 RepID=A0A7Y9NMX6_9BACT|nr:endonuclease III [Edaphobacter lichenicola]NYF52311.1 endonuclease-3 [Edaphobacter lichenicola]